INSKEWNCPRCTTDQRMTGSVVEYHFDEKSGPSFGYVAHNVANKEIIVAFRGTTTLADMVTDLKLSLTDWQGAGSGAKVHLGFKTAVLSVARPIEGLILTLLTQHTDHSIVFVGHSLGGAQASLAAAKFVAGNNAHKNKVSLYTYGQPRTGNSAFATWMNAQAFPKYRVTYGNDLITHLPFGGDYTHHTREIYYNHDDEIKLCSTSNGEDPDCINSVAGTSFKDHSEY
ncbi:alpha/beta-hydrolase, partial [Martensiomyces pterosporus]